MVFLSTASDKDVRHRNSPWTVPALHYRQSSMNAAVDLASPFDPDFGGMHCRRQPATQPVCLTAKHHETQ